MVFLFFFLFSFSPLCFFFFWYYWHPLKICELRKLPIREIYSFYKKKYLLFSNFFLREEHVRSYKIY